MNRFRPIIVLFLFVFTLIPGPAMAHWGDKLLLGGAAIEAGELLVIRSAAADAVRSVGTAEYEEALAVLREKVARHPIFGLHEAEVELKLIGTETPASLSSAEQVADDLGLNPEAVFARDLGSSAGSSSGLGIGPWGEGVTDVVKEGTFTQCGDGSCVAATGQILTEGKISEAELVAKIGEWSNPESLAQALNELEPGQTWQGGYFKTGADAVQAANRGPAGMVLQAPNTAAHMVTISPIAGSPGAYLVQDTGVGMAYHVTQEWIEKYVSGGVWK